MSHEPSDVELAAAVADVIAEPREREADSFVLHAPLELLARLALLPRVSPGRRDAARQRIVDVAANYQAYSGPVPPPADRRFDSLADATARLLAEVGAGDADAADAAAAWIGDRIEPDEIGALLGDALAPLLAAAGHAPIFLTNWPRICPRRELTGRLLRPLVRSLCRAPDWRIEWIDQASDRSGEDASLFDVLASTPLEGPADSDFIFPTMKRIDHASTGTRLIGPALHASDLTAASREVLRVAAWTMVTEPGPAAPYLWSHCLTMPQAVLGLMAKSADPQRLLAIAATHVTGFRSAYATTPLATLPPEPVAHSIATAIDTGQLEAAAAAWHTPPEQRATLVTELVDRAATHEDAHLVKYTLACLDAAAIDPEMAPLYLAAAASLSAWWSTADRLANV